jgi:hypothetical protein
MQIKRVIADEGKGGVAIQSDTINTDAIKYPPEPPFKRHSPTLRLARPSECVITDVIPLS